jgi:hypothetical protein
MHPVLKRLWEATPKPVQDDPPAPRSGAPVRLFIAPANYAGQGYRWSRAASVNPRVTASNMVYAEINPFDYPVDHPVRGRTVTHSRKWQRSQLRALTENFTHVLVEAEMPPLGGLWNQDVRRQVRALEAGGVRIGMICHGSDIRLPSRHTALEQWSPFANDDWVTVGDVERVAADNRALLDDLGLPTFVSTPGLLLDVPYAHLLPVVIDDESWHTDAPVLVRERPRVMHVPSNPLVKGTAQIEPVLSRLHDEGLIEYVSVLGRTHDEMPKIYGSADIVLDQFRLGDYGVAACEAMAAGRLVISHVSDQVRGVVANESGMRLPVLEANLDSLEAVLRNVLGDREPARALAAEGPAFVHRAHNGDLARQVLERHFLDR